MKIVLFGTAMNSVQKEKHAKKSGEMEKDIEGKGLFVVHSKSLVQIDKTFSYTCIPSFSLFSLLQGN